MSFAISFTVTLPYTAYQLYGFIAPAIFEKEKRNIITFVVAFVTLFLFGVAYSYYIIVPTTFSVLYKFVDQTRVMPLYALRDRSAGTVRASRNPAARREPGEDRGRATEDRSRRRRVPLRDGRGATLPGDADRADGRAARPPPDHAPCGV